MAAATSLHDDDLREPAIGQGSMRGESLLLPLQSTSVAVAVWGRVADVVVRQTFQNDSTYAIEATYLFPLPPDACMHRLRLRIGIRVVEGVVKGREDARVDYERALADGRAAALVEEDKPALLSLAVANVQPGAVIEVLLEYQDLVAFDDGRFRFTYPMTAPPRYAPSPKAADGVLAPRARDDDRDGDVAISVQFAKDHHDLSCSHPVLVDTSSVTMKPAGAIPNRDFVLEWSEPGDGVRSSVEVERAPGEPGTFLLTVAAPKPRRSERAVDAAGGLSPMRCGNCGAPVTDVARIRDVPGLGPVVPCAHCSAILRPGTEIVATSARPRDVLCLVDRSASMRGSEALVEKAVDALFRGLAPTDAAQLVAFDHERVPMHGDAASFAAVSPELAARARECVQNARPRGGSELAAALGMSAKIPPREGRSRIVVLVTDAAIGDEGRVLGRLRELLGPGARLFVLGVGASLDARLGRRLARVGGGVFDALVPGHGEDETLERFARRVASAGPVLVDVALYWNGAADVLPARIPDLHDGEALTVLGRFDAVGPTEVVVTGLTGAGAPFRQTIAVELPAEAPAHGIARLWARQKLDVVDDAAEGLRLGLAHSLVSRFTSLVAEDTVRATAKKRHRIAVVTKDGAAVGVFDGQRRVIGRAPSSDIVMTDLGSSRRHAEVIFDGSSFVIRDLASTNGTRVDGVDVREAPIRDGSVIEIHREKLVVAFTTGDDPSDFFEYVPIRRGVDARSGEAGRRDAAVVAADRGGEAARVVDLSFAADRVASARASPPMPAPAMSRATAVVDTEPPPRVASIVLRSPASDDGERVAQVRRSPAYRASTQAPSPGPQAPHAPVADHTSEPYPEHELVWLSERVAERSRALDLVFLIDATSSMGEYIREVQGALGAIVAALTASPMCQSLRIGVVAYRDHPPEERSFVTRTTPLTDDIAHVARELDALEAAGGGDEAEAVTDGLYEVVRASWRTEAARVVVWFGDGPPHGVERHGDAFPNGCPCGHHWFTQAESLREMGITVFAVGCLPRLRSHERGEEVFRTVARLTRGMYLPLREAEKVFVELVTGFAETSLDGRRIDAHVEDLVTKHAELLRRAAPEERVRWLVEELVVAGVRARVVDAHAVALDNRAPLRFRPVNAADVRASLTRLGGRLGW